MVTIRAAQIEDAPAMGRVMVDTWLSAHWDQIPVEARQKRKEAWTYTISERGWADVLREIAADPETRMCLYVAVTEAGEVVGLAMGSPAADRLQTGEVNAIYIRPDYQGQRLGRRLVQAVARHLARWGLPRLIIRALVLNAPARRFYEALGGRVIGQSEDIDEGVRSPLVIYGWQDTRTLTGVGTEEL